jgi:hypothetical protein
MVGLGKAKGFPDGSVVRVHAGTQHPLTGTQEFSRPPITISHRGHDVHFFQSGEQHTIFHQYPVDTASSDRSHNMLFTAGDPMVASRDFFAAAPPPGLGQERVWGEFRRLQMNQRREAEGEEPLPEKNPPSPPTVMVPTEKGLVAARPESPVPGQLTPLKGSQAWRALTRRTFTVNSRVPAADPTAGIRVLRRGEYGDSMIQMFGDGTSIEWHPSGEFTESGKPLAKETVIRTAPPIPGPGEHAYTSWHRSYSFSPEKKVVGITDHIRGLAADDSGTVREVVGHPHEHVPKEEVPYEVPDPDIGVPLAPDSELAGTIRHVRATRRRRNRAAEFSALQAPDVMQELSQARPDTDATPVMDLGTHGRNFIASTEARFRSALRGESAEASPRGGPREGAGRIAASADMSTPVHVKELHISQQGVRTRDSYGTQRKHNPTFRVSGWKPRTVSPQAILDLLHDRPINGRKASRVHLHLDDGRVLRFKRTSEGFVPGCSEYPSSHHIGFSLYSPANDQIGNSELSLEEHATRAIRTRQVNSGIVHSKGTPIIFPSLRRAAEHVRSNPGNYVAFPVDTRNGIATASFHGRYAPQAMSTNPDTSDVVTVPLSADHPSVRDAAGAHLRQQRVTDLIASKVQPS